MDFPEAMKADDYAVSSVLTEWLRKIRQTRRVNTNLSCKLARTQKRCYDLEKLTHDAPEIKIPVHSYAEEYEGNFTLEAEELREGEWDSAIAPQDLTLTPQEIDETFSAQPEDYSYMETTSPSNEESENEETEDGDTELENVRWEDAYDMSYKETESNTEPNDDDQHSDSDSEEESEKEEADLMCSQLQQDGTADLPDQSVCPNVYRERKELPPDVYTSLFTSPPANKTIVCPKCRKVVGESEPERFLKAKCMRCREANAETKRRNRALKGSKTHNKKRRLMVKESNASEVYTDAKLFFRALASGTGNGSANAILHLNHEAMERNCLPDESQLVDIKRQRMNMGVFVRDYIVRGFIEKATGYRFVWGNATTWKGIGPFTVTFYCCQDEKRSQAKVHYKRRQMTERCDSRLVVTYHLNAKCVQIFLEHKAHPPPPPPNFPISIQQFI
ncbi:hypothetical protein CANCADRAFT_110341 [Tortispora caseinolytica NRRL Y-17796]|uniref:Uncharacterized protein n=1 Tax=Tortispora caseinolytica NRRL Y-17796 TaxID=767744 RepID=A0A1E4TG72_9ASCO|nr:hypothetical protein CANCADRAFT_110341 [Tortispora caseinolytica NRRL Y-17796]